MKSSLRRLILVSMICFLAAGNFLLFMPIANAANVKNDKKIKYYRNPMNPLITSPTFMKDSMGMDYIAVYEDEEKPSAQTVKISKDKQELIGVKAEAVVKRPLMRMIRTVAKIAYDPDLYVAQEEYIQSLKTAEATKNSALVSVSAQSNSLVEASKLKLKLLGLSDKQVEELKTKSGPDRGLIISDSLAPYAWAYLTIYEYDLDAIKIGDHVALKVNAYPEDEFQGEVSSIDPVLDMNTRSVRGRVKIDNPQGKLKPNMYADAFLHIDLGENLALPKEAVLDTGIKKIVYVDLGGGGFAAREVAVGQEVIAVVDGQERKFYPVIKGLKENEVVVTSGNFLIDSQSQLTGGISALWGSASEIKQEVTGETGEVKTQHKH
ncbi:MAG: efflux RND transporter periplasmic adaptor subunit [Candidatus Omnitrophica bacterium]|nr:efflux RND transporter periplasmic adaptor subunit [Candidatus Omnitrophota bacterium]